MKLYHYTSFEKFQSIWKTKALWFSYSKSTNDYFEREKSYVYDQGKFAEKEGVWGNLSYKKIRSLVSAELEKYRQISFCLDYKKMPGYASPMMWGQYARSKDDNGNWQDGVCLELESDRFDKPSSLFYEHSISYPQKLKAPYLHSIDFTKENAAERFVIKYRNSLFFTKHKHWEHEREYRYISKYEGEIGISNAITGIYILYNDSTLNRIENLVKDDSLIYFVFISGTDNLHFEALNLREYRELLEEIKTINKSKNSKIITNERNT